MHLEQDSGCLDKLLLRQDVGLGCIVLHCPADLSTFNNLSQTLRRVMWSRARPSFIILTAPDSPTNSERPLHFVPRGFSSPPSGVSIVKLLFSHSLLEPPSSSAPLKGRLHFWEHKQMLLLTQMMMVYWAPPTVSHPAHDNILRD